MSSENGRFIRSRPVYKPLKFDDKGRFNILIGFGVGATAIENMVKDARDGVKVENTIVLISGSDTEQYDAELFFGEKSYYRIDFFDDNKSLLKMMPGLLSGMKMGLRLYMAGPERTIWQAAQVARDSGMQDEEFVMEACGSFARRVTCTHCTATAEKVTTNIFKCDGCGQTLIVNDHFSRRLAAYMGFRADAEIPGDFPEKVELYR